MPYYHYTSVHRAQDILGGPSGLIMPGRSGKIWLTTQRYDRASKAAEHLGITKLVDIVCEIPEERVIAPSAPATVAPHGRRPDGTFLRSGGGVEVTTSMPIAVSASDWQTLDLP